MVDTDCENICMAAMAIADGYQPELSAERIEAHLADCSACRREMGQLQALSSLLATQARRRRTGDVWSRIELRLPDASANPSTSHASYSFIVMGALLLGYRLIEIVPDRHLGFLFKLVPVLVVIAAFGYLRENPFKIDSELTLEGVTR